MRHIHWGRLFRRGMAVCLATIALWLLLAGAGAGAASGCLEELGGNEALITAALRTELGYDERELSFWERLVLSQSPLLWANLIPPGEAEAPAPRPNAQPAQEKEANGPQGEQIGQGGDERDHIKVEGH